MLDRIISIEELFIESKRINFKDDEYKKFLNGIMFDVESSTKSIVRVYVNNKFKGIGKIENNKLKRFIIE